MSVVDIPLSNSDTAGRIISPAERAVFGLQKVAVCFHNLSGSGLLAVCITNIRTSMGGPSSSRAIIWAVSAASAASRRGRSPAGISDAIVDVRLTVRLNPNPTRQHQLLRQY